MTSGTTYKSGDVVLATVPFVDATQTKRRPVLVLFAEYGNVIVAGITSNVRMAGIPLTQSDGAIANSVIKLNYVFTISEATIEKRLFRLSKEKWKLVCDGFNERLRNHTS